MTNKYNPYDDTHYHHQHRLSTYLSAYYINKEDHIDNLILTTVILASIYNSVLFSKREGYDPASRDLELGSTPRDPILKLTLTI